MTHPEYLEAFHEITVKVMPEIALALSKGEEDYAAQVVSALGARHDALWTQRQEAAVRESGNG